MGLIKNRALNLTEREVRYAMANTQSNSAAARFIGCTLNTYRKYAKQYIDEDTGKSLFELHLNQAGKGIRKVAEERLPSYFRKIDIFEILEGKHPTYSPTHLERRLIKEFIFPEECSMCGFNERRISDYKVPIRLMWKDGDRTNHHKDNLQFLCFNCYFLTYDDFTKPNKYLRLK